jgi:hypothetical protein
MPDRVTYSARWLASIECVMRNQFARPRLRRCGDRYMWEYPRFAVVGRPGSWRVAPAVSDEPG